MRSSVSLVAARAFFPFPDHVLQGQTTSTVTVAKPQGGYCPELEKWVSDGVTELCGRIANSEARGTHLRETSTKIRMFARHLDVLGMDKAMAGLAPHLSDEKVDFSRDSLVSRLHDQVKVTAPSISRGTLELSFRTTKERINRNKETLARNGFVYMLHAAADVLHESSSEWEDRFMSNTLLPVSRSGSGERDAHNKARLLRITSSETISPHFLPISDHSGYLCQTAKSIMKHFGFDGASEDAKDLWCPIVNTAGELSTVVGIATGVIAKYATTAEQAAAAAGPLTALLGFTVGPELSAAIIGVIAGGMAVAAVGALSTMVSCAMGC